MYSDLNLVVPEDYRAGYVAIIGEPNVGKSTLLNKVLGKKISVVTNKPQTTRHKILGILSSNSSQIIFLDTPGLLKPKYLLHEAMMKYAQSALSDADIIIFMIAATQPMFNEFTEMDIWIKEVQKTGKPFYLAINKIDLVKKDQLLPIIASYSRAYHFKEVFPISALESIGTDSLLSSLTDELPLHPPYYPPDVISEHTEKFFVSEIIREKIFEKFKEEIPYSTTVDIIEFKEKKGRKDLIRAEIYVERDSQKGILIGRQGKILKEVGELSRKDIERFLDRPVFLELYVRVKAKWRESEEWLKRLGYRS
jgi:GTP-binding protein Era